MKKGLIVFNGISKENSDIFLNVLKEFKGYTLHGTKGSIKDFVIRDEVHNIMIKIEEYVRNNVKSFNFENEDCILDYLFKVQKYVELYLREHEINDESALVEIDDVILGFLAESKVKVNCGNYTSNFTDSFKSDVNNLYDVIVFIGYDEGCEVVRQFIQLLKNKDSNDIIVENSLVLLK